ncbi:hypothetical protein HY346_02180 [Candidatus Microgenomates bacterium]|nr:hypothetical protein [Candidatus Microgenomates bacterium]
MRFTARLGLKSTLTIATVLAVILLVVMAVAAPDDLGPFGITLWFVGLLFASGGFIAVGLYELRRLIHRRQPREMIFATSLRQGVLVGAWLTALVSLNSLHQLGLKDIVLVTVLISLIEFYLRKLQ